MAILRSITKGRVDSGQVQGAGDTLKTIILNLFIDPVVVATCNNVTFRTKTNIAINVLHIIPIDATDTPDNKCD